MLKVRDRARSLLALVIVLANLVCCLWIYALAGCLCACACVFVRLVAARQQPAALRPGRPAGFTNEPTKEISRAAVAAALAGANGGAAATTDENVAPSATPASGSVVRPTPKVAVPSVSASHHTPKPPLSSLTRPTAASAAKSTSKAAATPRAAASCSKPPAGTAGSCSKCTPKSAGAKTATRTSLGGRTPTVTMTCRCEALDMLDDKQGETLEASFNDGDVSLNTSQEKSSEVDSSQSSAAASSSGSDGNQFGSPAAVGAPQTTTTLVFSATKLVPDLTGTSVLAARSPKLRTPPQTTGKIKVSAVGWCVLCCVCVCAGKGIRCAMLQEQHSTCDARA